MARMGGNNIFNRLQNYSRFLVLTLLLLFCSFSVVSAQKRREEPPPLKERLFVGGNFGLQFGTITDIQVSPVVGLWVLPRLAVAAGPDYRFYKDRFDRTNIYGGKGYLQFVVIKDVNKFIPVGTNTGIFFHIEDEFLSLETKFWKYPEVAPARFTINTVLAGGGISQQMGRRSSLDIMVLWALNDSGYGVYSNPEIRVSFIF
jgi:hypothetical protein